jgi:hypothetical protein
VRKERLIIREVNLLEKIASITKVNSEKDVLGGRLKVTLIEQVWSRLAISEFNSLKSNFIVPKR